MIGLAPAGTPSQVRRRGSGSRAARLLRRQDGTVVVSPLVRWVGIAWVVLTLPAVAVYSTGIETRDQYIFAMIFFGAGIYTTPALVAGYHALRRGPSRDRLAYGLIYAGLVIAYVIGLGMLVGVATGWTWANPAGVPAVVASGCVHAVGLVLLVRSRSGRRALSVDVLDSLAVVVAVTAPLVVLWGPAVAGAEAPWLARPAAAVLPFTIWGVYWTASLFVRLGPSRGSCDLCALGLAVTGTINASLQTAQGVTGFELPAAPLVVAHGIGFSMFLLLPLHLPQLLRPGLDRLPPQAQVRGARLATSAALAGLAALLAASWLVAGDRPWAVPFALGVTSLLVVLCGLRQLAAVGETRRLYRQVEEASEERMRLLDQLLERSLHDRQDFASQLYEQSVAAYTSFRTLAGAEGAPAAGAPSAMHAASAVVVGDLARQAESARELMMVLRPLGDGSRRPQRLAIPITAYVTTIYGDLPTPRLSLEIADELTLDWTTETMLLQIVREALHNVWRHSEATAVEVAIDVDGGAVRLRVTDDGRGFDPAAAVEGSGSATMRSSAAVVGGDLHVASRPGEGTTVTARVGPDPGDRAREEPAARQAEASPPEPSSPPDLRLVRGTRGEDG